MKSIKTNFIYNIAYQILVIILPLVTAPYISRTLGAEGVGIYSYTYSVVYYFQLFAMLGISNHGNRSIAAVRDDKAKVSQTFYDIYSIQLTTFSLASLVYIFYVVAGNVDNKIIAAIQGFYLISGLLDISWFFFGMEEFKLTVTRNTIIKLITTVSVFGVVKTPLDLWKYTLILAGGTFLSQSYLWFYMRNYINKCSTKINNLKKHIIPILTLFIPVISYSIYKVMDKIMLGQMCSYSQVGYYQNAEKIINIPMGVITALGTVMLPRMSNMVSNGHNEKAKSYISLSLKAVTIISSAIAFGLIGVSSVFTPVFYGAGYDACINLIRMLSLTVFFMAWANVVRTQYLIPQHKDKVYILSTFIGAMFNLIINIILIPKYFAIGAAVGTVVAEFSVLVAQIVLIRGELKVIKYIAEQSIYIFNGLIMSIIVSKLSGALPITVWSLFVLVFVGGTIYLILTVLYSCLVKDEVYKMLIAFVKKVSRKV